MDTFSDINYQDDRPADEVVDKIYAEVLEQLALPPAAAQKLIANETVKNKWKMIKMNALVLSNETMQAIRNWSTTDEEFLQQVSGSSSREI